MQRPIVRRRIVQARTSSISKVKRGWTGPAAPLLYNLTTTSHSVLALNIAPAIVFSVPLQALTVIPLHTAHGSTIAAKTELSQLQLSLTSIRPDLTNVDYRTVANGFCGGRRNTCSLVMCSQNSLD